MARRRDLADRIAHAIVGLCAPIVPASRRDDWRAEWHGELWHRAHANEQRGSTGARDGLDLIWRATGALAHALWLARNEWRLEMMMQDLAFALRTSLRRPAFTALVVGMLAVGIGANTAMFTVVNSVLLQPLPYDHAAELVAMNGSFSRNDNASISGPDFLDYRAGNRVFAEFSGYRTGETVLTGGDAPERLRSWEITADFFRTLHVAPIQGRVFLPEEEAGGDHDVALLSSGLWQRRFGADRSVVGTVVTIGGRPTRIVGVMPPTLDRTLGVDVWQPFDFRTPGTSVRRFHNMRGIARLKPGVTLAQAQASMDIIAKQLEGTYPENATWKLRLRPYQDTIVGDAQRSLMILLGAVGLVLLIACGNVASLLLARATSRQGEIGIRAALGASRMRLVRQLLTESLVLAAAGGAGGLVLAFVLVRGIRAFGAGLVPRLAEVSIDPTVLAFTLVVALGTGLVFGLAPALHAAKADVATTFAALGRSSSGGRGVRLRDALVVAQVALSLMLLVGAGLLVRSLWELQHVPFGFDADHIVTAQISLPASRYRDHDAQLAFWNAYLDRVRTEPGVASVSATNMLPMIGGGDTYFYRADRPPAKDSERKTAMVSLVADGYFETMHIAMESGRAFGAAERGGGPNTIVISKRMANAIFDAGENPVGKFLVVDFGKPFTAEIVGIAGDVRSYGPARVAPRTMYFSIHQGGGFGADFMTVVARTRGEPQAMVSGLRTALAAVDRDIPLVRPQPMADVVAMSTSDTQFASRLLGGFAVVALLLAVIGLYGVLTFAVAQRARELAIRIAFGARAGQVFSMVVRRGMGIVAIGVGLGLAGAFATTRVMASLLFQTKQTDPVVFVAVAVTLILAGMAACLIPARRATRVDPVTALRGD